MATNVHPSGSGGRPRQALRLTFRIAHEQIHLLRHERLTMIAPPSVGERPQAGKHGGYWIELRDANDRVLAHRTLHNPLGDSVEVPSPDGRIERVFGDVKENVFEVLLPDEPNAATIVFMGESLTPLKLRKKAAGAAGELARFAVPARAGGPGGNVP